MGHVDVRLSRRALIQGAGALVIGLYLPMGFGKAQAPNTPPPVNPNAFIRIGADDSVTVLSKHIEFGQGPFTGMATLIAEELDADWSKVRVEHAVADTKLYANLFMQLQGTGGSTSIANSYEQMRRAGAMARAMLVQAAANEWKVDPATITVDSGVIRHAASGRQGRFGQFAAAAAKLPAPAEVKLKDPKSFKLIGRDQRGIKPDSAAKSDGTAKFTIDIAEPGMLTVVVAHPERFGAKVASFDATEALKVKGMVAVKQIPTGVAVYANGTWPALKGRKVLKIKWDESGAEMRDSDAMLAAYQQQARNAGIVAAQHGDVDAALGGGEVVEAEYLFPFLAHATMEPMNGYLTWNAKGALARTGSQLQTIDQAAIAEVLGLKPEQVRLETMLTGGSFGRRATSTGETVRELAEAAKALGPDKPVKLIRTREDDIQGGYYRPLMAHRMRAAIRDGKVAAWTDTICGNSFTKGSPFESLLMQKGVDAVMVEGSKELPYDIPNFRCDAHIADTAVPTLWWRSVGHTHTGYAVEVFIDQLLEKTGKDPVAGRLELMRKAPRAAGALRAVADLAKWNGPGPVSGRARGVAVVESFSSYVAQIAEVSIDADGVPKVHKVWCAVDCGVAVNPDVVRAQMEGGIGYGLSAALFGEIALAKGKVVQSNFNDYRVLRIHEMPEIEVKVIASTEKPSGVGEPGVPPIAPAIANALARLGRDRPTRLPFVREMA